MTIKLLKGSPVAKYSEKMISLLILVLAPLLIAVGSLSAYTHNIELGNSTMLLVGRIIFTSLPAVGHIAFVALHVISFPSESPLRMKTEYLHHHGLREADLWNVPVLLRFAVFVEKKTLLS